MKSIGIGVSCGKLAAIAPLTSRRSKSIDAIFDIERGINGCSIAAAPPCAVSTSRRWSPI